MTQSQQIHNQINTIESQKKGQDNVNCEVPLIEHKNQTAFASYH